MRIDVFNRRMTRDEDGRITRDAFLYLEPKYDNPEFAQCSTCVYRLRGKMFCAKMAGRPVVALGSCAAYGEGDAIYEVVNNYSPEELGYVVRKVRCENCRFGGDGCGWFKMLNQTFPDKCNCDPKIKPQGCCNAQEPK